MNIRERIAKALLGGNGKEDESTRRLIAAEEALQEICVKYRVKLLPHLTLTGAGTQEWGIRIIDDVKGPAPNG